MTKENTLESQSTQSDVYGIDTNKENFSGDEQIVHRESIPGTPFTVITFNGEGKRKVHKWNGREEEEVQTDGDISFGALGKYRVTLNRRSISEVRDELVEFNWDTVMKIMAIIIPAEIERLVTSKQGTAE